MTQWPPISVILATTEPWPDLANCLAVLGPQVHALDGEIIVGDGHGSALTEDYIAGSDSVSWIKVPGASVFELRAKAVEAARGEIIATTEDHCVVGPDWCARILEAFASHPEAQAISGPILNGSRERLIDWANYLHTFGGFLPRRADQQGLPAEAQGVRLRYRLLRLSWIKRTTGSASTALSDRRK